MAKKSPNFAHVRELHKAGLLDDAEDGYLALLRINPRDPEIMHSLGIVHTQKKNFSDAISYLEKAINLAPKDPAIPLHLANVLKLQGLFSQAIQLLETTRIALP
jgi:Flp pilus assembly protein TadD